MAIRTTGVRYDLIARDSASRVFRTVGDSAGRLEGGLGKLAKTTAYAGAVLAGTLAAGLAKSAKDAVDFEATMKRVQTQAGATAKDVQTLSGQVLELGKSTQQGPKQLAEALYHLKSVGMDNAAAMKSLKVASDLAAVGGSDLEATTNALAGAWRSGIKGADTFSKAASTVNAVIGAGNMTMEQFVEAIGTGILPSAKSFGLSLNQVGAALALMTDEGIPAVDAATRLRMSFSLLGAPSKAADKQLKAIHLSGLDLAKAMRGQDGLIGAVQLLKDHLDASGLSAARQSQILSRSFGGGRSSSGILTLLNNLDVLKQKQDQVNNSMGKFGPAVEAQRKTAQAQLKLIESNLQVLSIEVGNKLLPPLTTFVTYLVKTAIPETHHFTTALLNMVPIAQIKTGFNTVEGYIQDFITGLKGPKKPPVLPVQPKLVLPKNLPPDAFQFGASIKVPVKLKPTVELPKNLPPNALEFGATIKTPKPTNLPPSAIRYGITPHISTPGPKQKSQAQTLGEQLRALISGGITKGINDAVSAVDWGKLGKQVGDGLGKAFEWVGAHSSDLTKKLAKAIGSIDWANVGKAFGVLAVPLAIGFIDNLFAPLFSVDFWKKHWLDTIVAVISLLPLDAAFGAVGKLFGKIPWGKLGGLLDHVPWASVFRWSDWLMRPLGEALTGAGRFVTRLGGGFIDAFRTQFPRVAAFFGEQLLLLPVRLGDLGRMLKNKAGQLLTGFGETLVGLIPGWGNRFIRAALKFLGRYTFYQAGIQLVEGLFAGIGSLMTGVGKWINTNMVQPFINWVKSLFGIHSPSTVFASIGGDLMRGLFAGVLAGIAGAGKWLYSNVVAPVLGAFTGAGGWLYGRGSSMVSGLKSGALAGTAKIGTWMSDNVISPVTGAFSTAGTWLYSHGTSLITGLKSGITNGMADIGKWLKGNLVDPIVNAVKSWFGIKSPSRVFAGIGGHLVSGLVKGLATSNGLDIARTVFGDLPNALAAIVGKGLVHIEQLPGKAVKALQGLGSKGMNLLGLSGQDLTGGGAAATSGSNQAIGKKLMMAAGFGADQWPWLKTLWNNESGWRTNATNPSSGAYGIPQALPASKMGSAGADWKTNPATQIAWGLSYIKSRYGSPGAALAAWNSRSPHWYAAGGLAPIGQTAWVGEKGPELMQVTPNGTRIYNNRDSMSLAGMLGMQVPGYASGTVASGRVASATKRVQEAQAEYDHYRRLERDARSKAAKRRDQILAEAAAKKLAAAKAELAAAKKFGTATSTIANTLANGFLKTLETGSAAAIASAIKSMNTKLQAAGAGGLVAGNLATSSKLQSLANQRASIQSRMATAQQYASDQSSSLGDFLALSNTPAASISTLISRMADRQRQASGFASEVSALSKRGLDKTLLAQLAEAGPGSQLAALLAKASSSDIGQLNELAASQQKLTVSFGRTMADAMYDSGAQAGKGFLSGLQAQEKAIQAEMNRLAAGMVTTIKKKLGIKSPSTVMRDQVGKQVVMGAAAGVRQYGHHATREVQRMADTMAAVRARTGTSGVRGGGGTQEVHHHHETNYTINARTVDMDPQQLEVVQRRNEARQRVGRPR